MSKEKPLELSLEDESVQPRGKPRLAANAYNPYDVDPRAPRKDDKSGARTDLRKLSQWIKLKREVDELKATEDAPAAPPGKPKR
ncbi:MAG: hypothetical protein ABW136_12220 [Steroidobacteraceae bacterium]